MNVLGISYYRFVKESGEGSWYQVYVKSIFGPEEITEGEIYGVVGLKGAEDETSGHKLLRKLDKIEANEGLSKLIELTKEEKAVGGFVQIFVNSDGERMARACGVGGIRVGLLRKGKLVWLIGEGRGGPVVGSLNQGDKLLILSEGVLEMLETSVLADEGKWQAYVDDLIEKFGLGVEKEAMAGMLMAVGEYQGEEKIEKVEKVEEVVEDEVEPSEKIEKVEKVEEVVEDKQEDKEELSKDRLVGKVNLADRLKFGISSWKSLLSKRNGAVVVESESRSKRKRLVSLVGMIFLISLVVSVSLGMVKTGTEKAKMSYENEFAVSERKLTDAEANFSLNPSLMREVVADVLKEIEEKRKLFDGQKQILAKIDELKGRAEKLREKVSGEEKANLELFFSLEIVRPNMKATVMGGGEQGVVVVDAGAGVGVKISYPEKKPELVLGRGESSNWDSVSWSGDLVAVAGDSNLTGIVKGQKKQIDFDSAVGKVVAMDGFGANLYLLDQGSSEVWKYAYGGGEFSGRQRWLAPGVTVDLSKATDLVIDGDIWIANEDKVTRLRRGNKERYVLEGVPDAYKVDKLATMKEGKSLVVLDKAAKRLLVIDKETGVFVKQLASEEFGKASDVVFVEQGVVLVSAEGSIYKVKI